MILYIENPEDATRKLAELINEFGKIAGYKINAQKALAFLYTNDEESEREIMETLPFTIATKRIKESCCHSKLYSQLNDKGKNILAQALSHFSTCLCTVTEQ